MTNNLYLVVIIEYLVIEECVKKIRENKEGDKKWFPPWGLLLIPCYVISKYDLIVLISEIPYMDA